MVGIIYITIYIKNKSNFSRKRYYFWKCYKCYCRMCWYCIYR